MITSFLIVIVLYKTKIYDSSTLNTLNKIALPLSKVIIWDNSLSIITDAEMTKLKEMFSNLEYQHTPKNISLARIYNTVYNNNPEYDFFLIFDQDTSITWDYFTKLQSAILEYPEINLFLPLVYNENKIVSPGNFFIYKGVYWKKKQTGMVSAKNRLAIASGMAIRMDYLKNTYKSFDERLKLYGIDTQFMIEYGKKNKFFYVLDYKLIHHLSIFTNESSDIKAIRFIEHRNSLKIICKSISLWSWLFASIILFATSILLAIKLKRIDVIFN